MILIKVTLSRIKKNDKTRHGPTSLIGPKKNKKLWAVKERSSWPRLKQTSAVVYHVEELHEKPKVTTTTTKNIMKQ